VIDACVPALEPLIGTGPAWRAAGKSKFTHYRRAQPPMPRTLRSPLTLTNALSATEIETVLKGAALGALPGPGPGPGVGHPPRRGVLPVLHLDDVPHPAGHR
jgi:hypothetical protein